MFEENLKNSMGLEFYNLSHRFGYQSPNWPYFEDVKIERIHYMAKSGVLSQRITTSMHNTTHIDAPAHVIQGTPFIDEVPLPHFFGSGTVLSRARRGAVARRMVRQEEGQSHRPRHPGQRSPARHGNRPAAQRTFAPSFGRGIRSEEHTSELQS